MTRSPSRVAHSLIELAVVLTVSSALMVMAAGWIQRSLKFGSIIRTRQTHHQNLLRLANLLRDDVHRGRAMEMAEENQLVIDLGNDQQIVYTIEAATLSRASKRGDETFAEDAFPLATTTTLGWDTSGLPATIELVVGRGRGVPGPDEPLNLSDASEAVDLYVRASVNRWNAQAESVDAQAESVDAQAESVDAQAKVDP